MTLSIQNSAHFRVVESSGFVEVCLMADRQSQVSYEVMLLSEDDTAIGEKHACVVCKAVGNKHNYLEVA